jgi:hypothetical protein
MFSALYLYFVSSYTIQSNVYGFVVVFLSADTLFKGMLWTSLLHFVSRYTIHRHIFVFIVASCQQLHYSKTDSSVIVVFCQQLHYSKTRFRRYCCILSADKLVTHVFYFIVYCQQIHYSKIGMSWALLSYYVGLLWKYSEGMFLALLTPYRPIVVACIFKFIFKFRIVIMLIRRTSRMWLLISWSSPRLSGRWCTWRMATMPRLDRGNCWKLRLS